MTVILNRRAFAALPIALATGLAATRTRAQTPMAGSTTDQIQLYGQQRDDLLTAGRTLLDAFVSGDDESFSSQFDDPSLAAVSAAEVKAWLENNRLRLRWQDGGLLIDASFDGSGTMTGYAWNWGPAEFVATSDNDQAHPYPTGRWSGILAPGARDEPIVLTFDGDAETLSAVLDLPSRGVSGVAPTVTFSASQPIGDRIQDQALPVSPVNQLYRAEYVWGDALLSVDALRGPEGGFNYFATALYDLLPPDPAVHLEPAATYRLPASDQLFVYWGGTTEFQNYHASTSAQRHALDLVRWEDGSTFRTDGMANEDYVIWGVPMLAPAAGKVVGILNDQPDIPPAIAQGVVAMATPVANQSSTHPAGNHVVIEVSPGTCVFLAHMQTGSISVNVGDDVAAGQPVGLVGNSGNTSEPHIHVHAQTSADIFDPEAIGLPMVFDEYLADGVATSMDSPVQGQFVEQQ